VLLFGLLFIKKAAANDEPLFTETVTAHPFRMFGEIADVFGHFFAAFDQSLARPG